MTYNAGYLQIQWLRILLLLLGSARTEACHVRKGDGVAKFWLEPVELVKSVGFRPSQLTEIRAIIEQNYENFIKQWDRYFG